MADDPPHPGPPPAGFDFPFAEARAAAQAIRALIDELASMVRVHVAAADRARIGFEGQTRQQFDSAFEQLMDAFDGWTWTLEVQLSGLEADLVRARRLRDQSETDRAIWQRRLDAWSAAQSP